ncbi:MAG: DUF928 domain-containing protein [Synechococcaceae cyanobacterium RL_1_2]|nr:DUF928 domain-containing protein [Synechococcaceae cyanobacterium RL_1_2]
MAMFTPIISLTRGIGGNRSRSQPWHDGLRLFCVAKMMLLLLTGAAEAKREGEGKPYRGPSGNGATRDGSRICGEKVITPLMLIGSFSRISSSDSQRPKVFIHIPPLKSLAQHQLELKLLGFPEDQFFPEAIAAPAFLSNLKPGLQSIQWPDNFSDLEAEQVVRLEVAFRCDGDTNSSNAATVLELFHQTLEPSAAMNQATIDGMTGDRILSLDLWDWVLSQDNPELALEFLEEWLDFEDEKIVEDFNTDNLNRNKLRIRIGQTHDLVRIITSYQLE